MVKKGRLETVERDRLRDDLDSMSEAQLERLHAGLMRLAELPPKELQAFDGEPARRRSRRLISPGFARCDPLLTLPAAATQLPRPS
jgi:hypothetical protein